MFSVDFIFVAASMQCVAGHVCVRESGVGCTFNAFSGRWTNCTMVEPQGDATVACVGFWLSRIKEVPYYKRKCTERF